MVVTREKELKQRRLASSPLTPEMQEHARRRREQWSRGSGRRMREFRRALKVTRPQARRTLKDTVALAIVPHSSFSLFVYPGGMRMCQCVCVCVGVYAHPSCVAPELVSHGIIPTGKGQGIALWRTGH